MILVLMVKRLNGWAESTRSPATAISCLLFRVLSVPFCPSIGPRTCIGLTRLCPGSKVTCMLAARRSLVCLLPISANTALAYQASFHA